MSVPININGTVVQFPAVGASPEWAEAVIQSIQLIAQALNISAGSFDVPPQTYVMTSNVNTNVPIPNLAFPTSAVQGAVIFLSVNRSTTGIGATAVSETDILIVNYDPTRTTNKKWQVSREFTNSGAFISFAMDDTGQINFTTTSISGSSHSGTISFRGLAVLQS